MKIANDGIFVNVMDDTVSSLLVNGSINKQARYICSLDMDIHVLETQWLFL